ncbi:MAG: N-carbamoylputrescine amidase [Lachnospiraceae bacterium]|nr:N-carbamoylputrescine amidase [Lachnospiraceae bacterium]
MRKAAIAVIQMQCGTVVSENIEKADRMVRQAAERGANVILLPELFERQYFCQERRYEYYHFAKPLLENDAVLHFQRVAKELGVVLPISFYEKDGYSLYNSIAMIDADGSVMGVYRKTHIPDDHYYQEKFYFTPGNTGFHVWETRFGRLGVGICWDQWFPESARCMALQGAEIILYPTAIGSEPILECDSMPHWRRCMQGHAASNLTPVAAANRIGLERVEPAKENGGQNSSLLFYGSSFITDETGEIVCAASRDQEEILTAAFDLDEIEDNRMSWGLFRDRRPGKYKEISGKHVVSCGKNAAKTGKK